MFQGQSRSTKVLLSSSAAATLVLVLLAPTSASANEVGAYYPATFPTESQQSFFIMDGETSDYIPSHVIVTTADGQQHLCDNIGNDFGASADVLGADSSDPCGVTSLLDLDPETGVGTYLSGRALLEPCTSAEQEFCIESLSLGTETLTPATFNRQAKGPRFAGSGRVGEVVPVEGLGEFSGGTVSLWTSTQNHSGGTGNYALNVAAFLEAKYGFNEQGIRVSYLGLGYSGISASVTPFVEIDTSGDQGFSLLDLTIEEKLLGGDFQVAAWVGGDGPRCAFAELDRCGRIVDFAEGTKVGLSLRVPKEIGGFFKGRMLDPNIEITSLSERFQRIEVTAEPVKVPRFEHTMATADIDRSDVVYSFGPDPEDQLTVGDIGIVEMDPEFPSQVQGGLRGGFPASTYGAFDIIEWLKDRTGVDDTISGFNTIWSFGTLGEQAVIPDSIDQSDPLLCLADTTRVLGVVTSNAMAYQDSPPIINFDGSLSYTVAGMHFETDGVTPVQGTYDLVLASDVARCLYPELQNAPAGSIEADVNITEVAPTVDGSDVAKTATVTISEANNWLKLSAYGFTFSTNDIAVSLRATTQEAPAGGSAPAVIPVTTPPAAITPPVIPAGQSGAVLIGGVPANVTISPNALSRALEIKGTDWSLGLTPDSAGASPLNAKGELVLNPQGTTDLAGTGFQANSKASAFLIPRGGLTVAALGMTQANLRLLSTPVSLGEISVNASGAFSANLDFTSAKPGDYILQINGAAPDGKIRSISVAANVLDVALKGWTKKLSANQAKVYVKNVVAGGKVQIFVNGREIAWVNAVDETDPKLRKANGFNYLVRTINLVPGKNRVEIKVDGERERFTTYTR